MYIAQYYADTLANRYKIIALAELLGCDYRTVENIIAVLVNDDETLAKLKNSECPPYTIQKEVS